MKRLASLQGRLVALVLAGVGLLWIAAALATWFDARHELDELLDAHLAQSAALLVAGQLDDDDDDGVVDAPQLHRYAPRVAFQVWHEGRLLVRSPNAPAQPMAGREAGFETLRVGKEHWRVFAARGAAHHVQVYVGESIGARGAILRAVLRSMLWPALIALPLLGLAAWWAVRQGLAPLRALSEALRSRAPQALEPLAPADVPAEMQPLLAALNGLFGRIAALLESERRFTADAAHELRTPIAAIRAQAQVALGAAKDDQRHHALAATLAGCDRASHLVEQLLTLSRLEAGTLPTTAPVDLAALARRVAGTLAGHALARRQEMELEAEVVSPVRGDEALLGVLLRNLLDNALRYSPDGARIRARVQRTGDMVEFSVDDSGPGLADADRARLGERFFRVLGNEAPGSGLGWSIVRRIADAHGARIEAGRSAALGGLAVTVRWPVG